MERPRLTFLPWILVGALGILWLGKSTTTGAEKGQIDQAMPLVVEALRDTKFLRSAEMQMQETFEYSTHRDTAGWASAIPGADSLVASATKNSVWVAAHGTVGAGIDLSKADVARTATGITVTVPKAQLETPLVQLRLMSSRRGPLWDDRSISLKAQQEASERFQIAANVRGLKRKAMDSAKVTLEKLFHNVTTVPISVRFKA